MRRSSSHRRLHLLQAAQEAESQWPATVPMNSEMEDAPQQPVLHPQLATDCHPIARLSTSLLLLHRNAILPWFLLVPETDQTDLLQLPEDFRNAVMAEASLISRFVRQRWRWEKINFAAIGNVVPQLHLHVIGRFPGDACWPKPVWGNLTDTADYGPQELESIRSDFQAFRQAESAIEKAADPAGT